MAFINEYISEEDIEKYQINELMNSYQGEGQFPDEFYPHRWTIDKERESWFMWVDTPTDPLDYTRSTGERIFILHYKGENIEIVLRKDFNESSSKLTDNPFYVTWKLDRINKPETLKDVSDEEIIEVLREALNAYGADGMDNVDIYKIPEDNIIVKLKVEGE